MRSVLEFLSYKPFLEHAVAELGKSVRGPRSRLAEAMACRPGYVSQVLDGDADLSPDQAGLASEFLAHTDEESEYFLTLVLKARAGTPELRAQIQRRLERQRAAYRDLKDRLKVQSKISEVDEALFYSSWHYMAALTLISVPAFQTQEAISQRLRLSPKRTAEIMAQLESSGLVIRHGSRYRHGTAQTHLSKDSPFISRHHANWRLQAIQAVERVLPTSFHYSSAVSISAEDIDVVKAILAQAIEDIVKVVTPSKEEKVCSLCVDFFEL